MLEPCVLALYKYVLLGVAVWPERKLFLLAVELSKMWAEKPSVMNSGNRDVFIPPELSGLIDEPQALSKTLR